AASPFGPGLAGLSVLVFDQTISFDDNDPFVFAMAAVELDHRPDRRPHHELAALRAAHVNQRRRGGHGHGVVSRSVVTLSTLSSPLIGVHSSPLASFTFT